MRFLLCASILFVALGCSKLSKNDAAEEADALYSVVEPPKIEEPKPVSVERKLIRNGSVSFQVSNVSDVRKKISEALKNVNGYVASENENGRDVHPIYNQVLRIPSTDFDAFILQVETFATKIDSKNFSAKDVTEEYVDIESRLIAKKELEARYREIVKQAKTVKDILEVEEQIGYVRTEIESMQGRLKFLNNQVSYSTLELTYYEPYVLETPRVSGKFAESFRDGWNAFTTFLVAVTATWPFLIIIGIAAWLIMRRRQPKEITPR